MDGGEGHDGALTVGSRLTHCTISNRSYMPKGLGPVRTTQFSLPQYTSPWGASLVTMVRTTNVTFSSRGQDVSRCHRDRDNKCKKQSSVYESGSGPAVFLRRDTQLLHVHKAITTNQSTCRCFLCKRSKYIIQSLLRVRQFSSHDFRDPHRHRSYHIRMMAVCNIKIDQMVSYVWIPRSKGRE